MPTLGILSQINKALEIRSRGGKKRDYLGASALGEECPRKMWYGFHRPKPEIEPRVQRIFDMGNMIEDYLVKILIESGLTVWDKDPEGKQWGFVDGIVKGHCDGVIQGMPESDKPHLLEIKSAKNSRFKEMMKSGIETSNYQYYIQANVYAYKLKLDKILYIVYNKDTSELYTERGDTDSILADGMIKRGKEIVENEIPDRAYKSSTFFKCKWCDFAKECWQ